MHTHKSPHSPARLASLCHLHALNVLLTFCMEQIVWFNLLFNFKIVLLYWSRRKSVSSTAYMVFVNICISSHTCHVLIPGWSSNFCWFNLVEECLVCRLRESEEDDEKESVVLLGCFLIAAVNLAGIPGELQSALDYTNLNGDGMKSSGEGTWASWKVFSTFNALYYVFLLLIWLYLHRNLNNLLSAENSSQLIFWSSK